MRQWGWGKRGERTRTHEKTGNLGGGSARITRSGGVGGPGLTWEGPAREREGERGSPRETEIMRTMRWRTGVVRVRAFLSPPCPSTDLPLKAPGHCWALSSSFSPDLPSTVRGRDWTVVTVVTMVPSGMMVRSSSTFLVGVMLGRGMEGVGFRGEPSSY